MRRYKNLYFSLCQKIESQLPPRILVPEVWLWENGTLKYSPSTRPTRQINPWLNNDRIYIEFDEFQALLSLMREDERLILSGARYPGYGHKETIIINSINENITYEDNHQHIDRGNAYKCFIKKIKFFAKSEINFSFRARLYGITFRRQTKIGNFTIRRLTHDEINSRQVDTYLASLLRLNPRILAELEFEAVYSNKVTIDDTFPQKFLEAEENALKEYDQEAAKFIKALRLFAKTKCGIAITTVASDYGPISHLTSNSEIPSTKSTIIQNNHLRLINRLLAQESPLASDNALSISYHYFTSGKNKHDNNDKIVDYVMALEAILLKRTIGGKHQDISYKFMLNGSSLLCTVYKHLKVVDCFKFMGAIYNIRSKITHGSSRKDIEKVIKDTNTTLDDIITKTEQYYEKIFVHLLQDDTQDRPYNKANGWEHLFWDKALNKRKITI